jgi:hypothetical protein
LAAIKLRIKFVPEIVPRGTSIGPNVATFFLSTASYEGTFAGKLDQVKLAPQGEQWLEQE